MLLIDIFEFERYHRYSYCLYTIDVEFADQLHMTNSMMNNVCLLNTQKIHVRVAVAEQLGGNGKLLDFWKYYYIRLEVGWEC